MSPIDYVLCSGTSRPDGEMIVETSGQFVKVVPTGASYVVKGREKRASCIMKFGQRQASWIMNVKQR
jgi:hypothetical protein